MSEQLVDYATLDDEAKEQARQDFINYYVRQFKVDNLEVISSLADDRDLAMVNHLLEENRYQTVDQLIPLCERMVANSFDLLIDKLGAQFQLNGEPQQTWSAWEQAIHDQLPVED
ncbi:hypothetical protein [uncultured Limosilactobacillus sp.]|uniref:hypothetical protein n=1 Tax=uncultured Limosilactobacillus sp. TaxID=2837629 RepID=UPI0025F6B80E|nr:hypothetical protein [uncultured Limosilactobacillus sp.]